MTHEFVHVAPPTAAPPAVELHAAPVEAAETARQSGPAAAVVLGAGVASFVLGLLSALTAASAAVSDALTLSSRVGDVSGVTTIAACTFFVASASLAIAWRRANPPLVRVAVAAALLLALGLLGSFPPFFNALGG